MLNNLYNIKIFRYTYYVLLAFLFFSGISISISQGLLLLGSALFAFGLFKNRNIIKHNKIGLERYIIVFITISFVLAFLSPSIIKNLDYIRDFWLISAFILTYYLHDSNEDIIKTVYMIILIVLIQSIIALIQISFNFSFIQGHNNIGIFNSDDTPEIRGGLLGMHLVFSCYFMLIAIPVIYISTTVKKITKNNIRWILITAAVLSIAVLLVTRTRAIIITLPFSIVPLFFVNKKVRILAISPLLVLIVFASIVLIYHGQDQFSGQVRGNILNSVSTDQRIKIWKTAFHVWLKHPVIGAGGGYYLDEFKQVLKEHPEYDTGMVTHAHNDYLNQLARKGVIGFAGFIYMLYGIFRYMAVNLKYIKDIFLRRMYLGLFGAYCVFLAASIFQCFYTDEENLVMFWFVIGLLAAIVKIEKSSSEKNNNTTNTISA